MGGRRGVTILSHRPVTSSDLKQDRLFFRESVSTFLQLVVARLQRIKREEHSTAKVCNLVFLCVGSNWYS